MTEDSTERNLTEIILKRKYLFIRKNMEKKYSLAINRYFIQH